MTYLQIMNAVMRRLREDEVSTYSQSEYSKLVGDWINETKREVEDAWNWTALRTSITVSTVSGTKDYTLTGAGDRSRILQVINDTQDTEMKIASYSWMNKQNDIGSTTNAAPMYYNVNGSTSGDADVTLHPKPDAVYSIKFYTKTPQADLAADGTELTLPSWPVILGTYAKALSERGEDGGTQFGEAFSMYNTAVADSIAMDSQHTPSELVWGVR